MYNKVMKNTPKRPHGNTDHHSIRIWDKEHNEWLNENDKNTLPYYGFDPCCGEVVLGQKWPLDHRQWLYLEADCCTGIPDKNGEPIYEHDIIITEDGHDFNRDFEDSKYFYLILWEVVYSEDARYSLKPLNAYEENYRKDFFDFNDPTKEWEIVGHTHGKIPKWFCDNCGHFFETGKFDENDDEMYDDVCPMCGCAPCVPTKKIV